MRYLKFIIGPMLGIALGLVIHIVSSLRNIADTLRTAPDDTSVIINDQFVLLLDDFVRKGIIGLVLIVVCLFVVLGWSASSQKTSE